MSERLCVVMPVYNERDAIGAVLEKWDATLKALHIDYEIRPYNDGSKDDTLAVMRDAAQRLGDRVNVRDKVNGGHGNTILTGYREAAADGFDWIFQIDSDDEMGPEKFNELWSRRNDYDFLVGIRDGRVQALPRKIVSFVSRLCIKLFYGRSVWDVNTPYRLMRVSAFKEFYAQIPLTTFAPNVILSGLAARYRLRCFETRVPQHDRTTGEVSIKKWKLLKAAMKSFVQTIVFSFKPMGWKSLLTAGGLMLGSMWIFASNPLVDYTLTDGSVFLYVSERMHDGLIPYRDIFDHKGPLLYFLNYLGTFSWPSTVCLWIIETLFLGATLLCGFLFLRRNYPSWNPLPVLITFLALFFKFMMGSSGNLTEAWSVPFVLFILLSIHDAVRNGYVFSGCRSLAVGACSAAIILLRPNNAPVAFIAALYWFFEILPRCGVRVFLQRLSFAVLGFSAALAPFLLYYAAHDALNDLWACCVTFNIDYLNYLWWWENAIFWVIPFIVLDLFFIVSKECGVRRSHLYNLIYLVLSSGVFILRPNGLYMLVILPGFILPTATLVQALNKPLRRVTCSLMILYSVMVLSVAFLRANLDVKGYLQSLKSGGRVTDLADWVEGWALRDAEKFLSKIEDRNSVCVLGNSCSLYRHLGVKTDFKYPYQTPIIGVSTKIQEAVAAYILSGKESCFICQRAELKIFQKWLEKKYVCVDQTDNYLLYVRK